MTPSELQSFLHQNIPASAALSLGVKESSPQRVVLSAPISANRNHHHTVFGGSISMLATLCGWSLVHLNYPEYRGKIVIQESRIRYTRPAPADLSAVCEKSCSDAWQECSKMLAERGKGKITVTCILFSNGIEVAHFEGKYVVLA